MRIEPKYYFVYYECDRMTSGHGPSDTYTLKVQAVIDKHPLQWQIETNEEYAKWRDDGHGGQCAEDYRVVTWNELTVEEYKEFKDKIG